MLEVQAPNKYNLRQYDLSIFLGGSIEMNLAKQWQKRAVVTFKKYNVLLLNPRRDDWDSSWANTRTSKEFRRQVLWELEGQEDADVRIYCIDPATKSPITLLEIGLYARRGQNYVICPKGFWRKGNIDIVCERYGVPVYPTLKSATDAIISYHKLKQQ